MRKVGGSDIHSGHSLRARLVKQKTLKKERQGMGGCGTSGQKKIEGKIYKQVSKPMSGPGGSKGRGERILGMCCGGRSGGGRKAQTNQAAWITVGGRKIYI